ncbi:hypothetical protein GGF31_006921 [Allomyces arbusculus]|nr:hypothetical protein GGF31_006921 [Allomyces arbusculus]
MDVVVDLTLSQLMEPEKPALEPVIVPASLGFLPYLHDPDVPYFKAMFSGDWAKAETVRTGPIQFTAWSAPAVALAFIHIYSGWTPDVAFPTHTPTDPVADFACDPAMLSFATWRHLLDLAQCLGLKEFAMSVNRKLIALLEEQSRELAAMPDVLPDENPRPHKRARVNGDAPAVAVPPHPGTVLVPHFAVHLGIGVPTQMPQLKPGGALVAPLPQLAAPLPQLAAAAPATTDVSGNEGSASAASAAIPADEAETEA